MILRKSNKKGMFVDLEADLAGVILFLVALLFFMTLFWIKSCGDTRSSNFGVRFGDNLQAFLSLETLKSLNLNTDLAIKEDDMQKTLTPKDLICLYYTNKDSFELYNLSKGREVSLSKDELLDYTFDVLNKSLTMDYYKGEILINFTLLQIYLSKDKSSGIVFPSDVLPFQHAEFVTHQFIPCSNFSVGATFLIMPEIFEK